MRALPRGWGWHGQQLRLVPDSADSTWLQVVSCGGGAQHASTQSHPTPERIWCCQRPLVSCATWLALGLPELLVEIVAEELSRMGCWTTEGPFSGDVSLEGPGLGWELRQASHAASYNIFN